MSASNKTATVPVTSVESPRNYRLWLKQHQRWLLAALVIILAVLISAYLHIRAVDNHNKQLEAERIAADNKQYATLIVTSNNLNSVSKYSQAADLWLGYAAQTPSRQHKAEAYANAALADEGDSKYAQAYALCKKSEALVGITYDEAQVAATAAQWLGKPSVAISYYRQAIKLIPPSISDSGTQKYVFNQTIQQLESKL